MCKISDAAIVLCHSDAPMEIIPHNMHGFHTISLFLFTLKGFLAATQLHTRAGSWADSWKMKRFSHSLMSWCTALMYCTTISCNHLTCGVETLISKCTPNGITLGRVDQHQYTTQSYEPVRSLLMLINSTELCHWARLVGLFNQPVQCHQQRREIIDYNRTCSGTLVRDDQGNTAVPAVWNKSLLHLVINSLLWDINAAAFSS